MPTHHAVGHDADTLDALVAEVERERSERIIEVLKAGDGWTVVTEKRKPKAQTR